jgi:hypothetical protein
MKREMKPMIGTRVGRNSEPNAIIDLLREGLNQSAVHVNLGQQVIIVTEDRLRQDLRELSDSTRHRQDWRAPAGMLITEMAALATSSFHDAIRISAQQWQSVFQMLIVVTVLWLLVALIRGRHAFTADSLIEKLKTSQPRRD